MLAIAKRCCKARESAQQRHGHTQARSALEWIPDRIFPLWVCLMVLKAQQPSSAADQQVPDQHVCMRQVSVPTEFQGTVIGDLNRRKGTIVNSEGDEGDTSILAQVRGGPCLSKHGVPAWALLCGGSS